MLPLPLVLGASQAKDSYLFAYFKGNGETGLHLAYSNDGFVSERAIGPYGPASAPITGSYWAEGPSAVKIGEQWIVYFDKYRDRRYGAVVSKDFDRWEDKSYLVKFPEGARHGTVLRIPRGMLTRLYDS